MTDTEELDAFLSKVNDVSALVAALRSDDPATVKRACERVDRLTGGRVDLTDDQGVRVDLTDDQGLRVAAENRRGVNPRPSADPATAQQEDFKRQLEADAAERTENRRKAKVLSDEWKDKAIQSFREENYGNALEQYSKALSYVKDSCLLYTSRAQTLLKLNRPTDALQDLDWALRLDENSLRAWVHKGKAHQQLQQLDEAVDCYEKAIELHPDQKDVVQVYIRDLKRWRDRESVPVDETIE